MTLDNVKKLGMAGEGQLGRMMAEAAPVGIEVVVYGTARNSPAGQVVKEMIVAKDYRDQEAWQCFAASVDVVTAEWENVPLSMLQFLESRVPVFPLPYCFEVSSDRLPEKQFAASCGFATAPYIDIPVRSLIDEAKLERHLPGILKTRSEGYDGKGQTAVNTMPDLNTAVGKTEVPRILEKLVPFAYEVSVIGVRSIAGDIAVYPVVRNTHVNGILFKTVFGESFLGGKDFVPKNIRDEATEMMKTFLRKLNYVGVLAIELFVMPSGELVFNEMAPRVHNSGHWTIEGCVTSQFENHVRAVCGLPLGPVQPRCRGAVMVNILGDEITAFRKGLVPRSDNEYVHDYGKADVRPGRKMGHVTSIY